MRIDIKYLGLFFNTKENRLVFLNTNGLPWFKSVLEDIDSSEEMEKQDEKEWLTATDISRASEKVSTVLKGIKWLPGADKYISDIRKMGTEVLTLAQRSQKFLELINLLKADVDTWISVLEQNPDYQKNKDVIDYFDLWQDMLSINSDLEKQFWYDIFKVLWAYKTYIETELAYVGDGDLSKQDYDRMINNVKTIVLSKFLSIPKIVETVKHEHDWSLKNMQWIVNARAFSDFSELKDVLFVSVKNYLKMQIPETKEYFIKTGSMTSHTKMRLANIKEGLFDTVIKDWNIPDWIIWKYSLIDFANEEKLDSHYFKMDEEWVVDSSFLNEKDQEIESNATYALLWIIWLQVAPYAGVVVWWGVDLLDISSKSDASTTILKWFGLIDKDYEVDKTWVDRALAWISIWWSLVWLNALIKWWKFIRLLKKVKNFDEEKFKKSLEAICAKKWISESWSNAIIDYIFWIDEWVKLGRRLKKLRAEWWRESLFEAIDKVNFTIRSGPKWKELFINNIADGVSEKDISNVIFYLSKQAWAKSIKFEKWVLNSSDTWELSKIWRAVMWTIWENHPLVPILRLNRWDTAVNVTFKLKKLNDRLSPELADIIKDAFKAEHTWNFDKFYSGWEFNKAWKSDWIQRWRFLTASHKNTTYSVPEWSLWDKDIVKILFWTSSKDEVAANVINRPEVSEAISEYAKSKWIPEDKVKAIISEEFNFWVWVSKVDKDGWGLESFRNASNWSEAGVSGKDWNDIKIHKFTSEDTMRHAKNHIRLEAKILDEYAWKNFSLDWKEFPVVVDGELNWDLVQAVRKWEVVEPKELADLVEESSSELSQWADFISPIVSEDNFAQAEEILRKLNNWEVDFSTLERTYKWELTKDAFFEAIRWSWWMDIAIDIVWMWIDNRKDFRKLMIDFVDWRVTEADLAKKPWMSVTLDLLKAIREISKNNPDSIMRLWWDEIWIHIPSIVENLWDGVINRLPYLRINELMANINKGLGDLKWRITFGFDRRNKRALHDALDNEWKVSKVIENMIRKLWSTDSIKWVIKPKSVLVDISNSVWDELYAKLLDKDQLKAILWKEWDKQIIEAIKNPWTVQEFERVVDWRNVQMAAKFENWLLKVNFSQIDYSIVP